MGLLFIDFERPHRLRVQGSARLLHDDPVMANWTEAQYAVRVDVTKVWVNCSRYIHKYRRVDTSKYVPQPTRETPLALWKRLDAVQSVISDDDRDRAEREGVLDQGTYEAKMAQGDG